MVIETAEKREDKSEEASLDALDLLTIETLGLQMSGSHWYGIFRGLLLHHNL